MLTKLLRREPKNFEALCCKASFNLTQHHFLADKMNALRAYERVSYLWEIHGDLPMPSTIEAMTLAAQAATPAWSKPNGHASPSGTSTKTPVPYPHPSSSIRNC